MTTPETYIPPGHTPTVAENPLRRWRVEHRVSQPTAEADLQVKPGTVNAWESGKRLPRPEGMERLVTLTGIKDLPTLWHRWYVDHRL